MDNDHILSTFDNDLNRLNKDLLKLAKLATEQFVNSIDNFSTQNIEDIDKKGKKMDTGNAIGISILTVFLFISHI